MGQSGAGILSAHGFSLALPVSLNHLQGMVTNLFKQSTKIAALAALGCLSNCKKADAPLAPADLKFKSIAVAPFAAPAAGDDFSSITWGTAKAQPLATHEIQGEVVQGKLYIFGGFDVNKRPNWTPTKRAYVYNPDVDTWASIKSLPQEPNGSNFGGGTHVAVTTDGTDIYMAGGYTSDAAGTGQIFGTKQVWRYNVATNDYTRMPDLPQALGAGQLRYLNGKLHYMGGADKSRVDTKIHLVFELNNPAAGWKTLAPLNNAVNHPGAVVFNGKIYVMGGSHYQNEDAITQRTLQVYDEQTNTWTNMADMPFALDHILSSVVVYGNRIIVLGGQTGYNTPGKQVFAYDPATNVWQVLAPMRAAKSAGVAAVLNGYIHYTGGNFSAINYKGTPVFNTSTPSIELLPSADAFVRNGSFGTANYGTDTALVIKGATANNYLRSVYLKFSLQDISTVNSATLSVYGKNIDNTNSLTLSSFGIDDGSWQENSLTFTNAPQPAAGALSTAVADSQPKRINFDVTAFVKAQLAGDKNASFVIKDASNKNITVQFASKESSSNKPVLIIR
ncbi:CBM96 family carbohydrate-binding protein [Mucilaginibacter psychrotolerans]|uniref:DNRLRE domain-containing protein n=1 Tax=Mucilaginibacter psychrotolerans TaxID=1524096 RepID=A0A4Y8S2X9_9SPHI|nr:DNRLRE domain-containing protein [Mucilaginibacter psychrotolerans]TFF33353.1 DNRLRE domain-containing protein [Mucilaginibacter psychrotolerans]